MTIHPKHAIIPAILAASAALALVSFIVNNGYAASKPIDKKSQAPAQQNPSPSLSSKFPEAIQTWKSLIEENAEVTGLDPNLIGALILQESGGQPAIISSSGAVGLMQVMPRDGAASQFMCINGPCFKNRPSIVELNDPAFNIQYGTRYLSGLLNKAGSLREALKAYGPMDVGYSYSDIVLTLYAQYE